MKVKTQKLSIIILHSTDYIRVDLIALRKEQKK